MINSKLYNAAPAGWTFLPREFGEIGGSNVRWAVLSAEYCAAAVLSNTCPGWRARRSRS